MQVPQFDQLYVISDLHMGGEGKDRQIFNQAERLSAFINSLTNSSSDGKIGLVINGDTVDLIAEPNSMYFDTFGALGRLQRIYGDESFKPVFDALAKFVQTPGRYLTVVLGNHDVELALPEVRYWLVEQLCGGDDAARGRITTVFDGTGFRCRVGEKTVLCMHGNEVDAFNVVDYRLLLFISRELNRLKTPRAWDACAGTHLVVDVMNDIKRQHPFVDLLKPEIEATVAIILTLIKDPFLFSRVGKGIRVFRKLRQDTRLMEEGLLSGALEPSDDAVRTTDTDSSDLQEITAFMNEHFGKKTLRDNGQDNGDVEDQLLDAVFDDLQQDDAEIVDTVAVEEELLGKPALFFQRVLEKFGLVSEADKIERLRLELQEALDNDQTFDPFFRSSEFTHLDDLTGADVDYLVTGHTHMARAFTRNEHDSKRGFYFNSGTWVRIMELPKPVLNDPAGFAGLYQDFKLRPLTELDEVQVEKDETATPDPDEYDFDDPSAAGTSSIRNLVRLRPIVVTIQVDENGETNGQLQRANMDGSLRPLQNTRFPE